MSLPRISTAWIPKLAEPYLRGYRPRPSRHKSLPGFWFLSPATPPSFSTAPTDVSSGIGFFIGYLLDAQALPFLSPHPPECLIFSFIRPVESDAHRSLVSAPASLFRSTAEYISWLTHRPPRFRYFDDQPLALIRHASMREWPAPKFKHLSRNFFIETLAWLVRSALVRRLAALQLPATPARARNSKS